MWPCCSNELIPRRHGLESQLCNLCNVSLENLVLDQLIIPKLIFFSILITYLFDIVLILYGEILSWSLMGVKGLNPKSNRYLSSPYSYTAQPFI